MSEEILLSNEYIHLREVSSEVILKVIKQGYSIQAFNTILSDYPRIKVTNFPVLKIAFSERIGFEGVIGVLKPVIEISVSTDRLKAYAYLNITDADYKDINRKRLLEDILEEVAHNGIEFGMDLKAIFNAIKPREKFLIAEGMLPVKGDDAKVSYYEIKELQPEITEDGKVNHYELNLINKVHQGEWVGERIEPKEGHSGKTVYGEVIPALKGHQEVLKYDKKTIDAVLNEDQTVTTLKAKKVGAVVYENQILSVCNYLEIDGKVSFKTGNIDFDGFVEVKDSIEDNFSVVAEQDIQIMGQLGVGGVDSIESKDGNIYIRGGIAGKNKAQIICNKDLFTKFAADCTIVCQGTVHIGFYAMNCNIKAKEVILESYNSKIIGGSIEADVRVVAGEIGSKAETNTKIQINGFKRSDMKGQYDQINQLIDKTRERVQFLKQQLAVYDIRNMDQKKREAYLAIEMDYLKNKQNLILYTEQKKRYLAYLQTKGEGEVRAMKCIYPNVHLTIKNEKVHVTEKYTLPRAYYWSQDGMVTE